MVGMLDKELAHCVSLDDVVVLVVVVLMLRGCGEGRVGVVSLVEDGMLSYTVVLSFHCVMSLLGRMTMLVQHTSVGDVERQSVAVQLPFCDRVHGSVEEKEKRKEKEG